MIDTREMVAALLDVAHDCWLSIHWPLQSGQSAVEAIRDSHAALAALIS